MTTTTPQTIWTVIERDEDGIATAWRTAFTDMQDALSAVEAHSDQMAVDAALEAPELTALPTNDDEMAVVPVDGDFSWASWTVTRVTIAN